MHLASGANSGATKLKKISTFYKSAHSVIGYSRLSYLDNINDVLIPFNVDIYFSKTTLINKRCMKSGIREPSTLQLVST